MSELDVTPLREALASLEPGLSSDSWREFARIWSPVRMAPGDYLVRPGERSDRVVFVTNGVLRAYSLDEKGNEYNKTFFLESMFATPLAAILQDAPSHLGIQALTEVSALRASMRRLIGLADAHAAVGFVRDSTMTR